MTVEIDTARVAKFERVLPRLRLDRPAFRPGEEIALALDAPLQERADVLMRLVHESGRTYAERKVTLGPENEKHVLGVALNMPSGKYDVLLTPPLEQFFGTVPVERKIPCAILADPFRNDGAEESDFASRRARLLANFADGGDLAAALARSAGSTATDSGRKLIAKAMAGDDIRARFAAVSCGGSASGLEKSGTDTGLASTISRYLATPAPESRNDLETVLKALGTMGCPDDILLAGGSTISALAALHAAAPDDAMRDLAATALDRVFLSLACHANAGWLAPADAAPGSVAALEFLTLTWLAWGVGALGPNPLPALALAGSGYEVPPVLAAIARDATEGIIRERFLSGDETLLITTARNDDQSLTVVGDGSWQFRMGPDVVAAGRGAVAATAQEIRQEGATAPILADWIMDNVTTENAELRAMIGDASLAVSCSSGATSFVPRDDGAGRALEGPSPWTVRLGNEAGPSLLASPADDLILDAPFARLAAGDTTLEIRHGGEGLLLDFS